MQRFKMVESAILDSSWEIANGMNLLDEEMPSRPPCQRCRRRPGSRRLCPRCLLQLGPCCFPKVTQFVLKRSQNPSLADRIWGQSGSEPWPPDFSAAKGPQQRVRFYFTAYIPYIVCHAIHSAALSFVLHCAALPQYSVRAAVPLC